jgi:hypothetical protein
MTNRHTYIHNNVLAVRVVDDTGKHFPRVEEGISLQEPVEDSISCAYQYNNATPGVLRVPHR